MKLLTKADAAKLRKAPFRSTEGLAAESIPVIVKFFDPCGRGTWYATEAQEFAGDAGPDWEFFGYVVSPLGDDCDEYGYFRLSELASVRNRFGLGIERDRGFSSSLAAAIKRY